MAWLRHGLLFVAVAMASSALLLSRVSDGFRALLLANIVVLGWALNVRVLAARGVDVASVLGRRNASSVNALLPAAYIALWWALMLWVYQLLPIDWLPASQSLLLYSVLLIALFLPFDILCCAERWAVLSSLGRLCKPSLTGPVHFCDVLMADILTSFTKVLADLFDTLCAIGWYHTDIVFESSAVEDENRCNRNLIIPLITCIPFVIRFKQCMIEYWACTQVTNGSHQSNAFTRILTNDDLLESPSIVNEGTRLDNDTQQKLPHPFNIPLTFKPKRSLFITPLILKSTYLPIPNSRALRHLLNALKYATAFPVILTSAMLRQRSLRIQTSNISLTESSGNNNNHDHYSHTTSRNDLNFIFLSWYIFALINSMYSFYWDVFIDWSLGQRPNSVTIASKDKSQTPTFTSTTTTPTNMLTSHNNTQSEKDLSVSVQRRLHYTYPLLTPNDTNTIPEVMISTKFNTSTSTTHETTEQLLPIVMPITTILLSKDNDYHYTPSTAKPLSPTFPLSTHSSPLFPSFTRPIRLFSPAVYYIAILMNFLLRFSWSITVLTATSTTINAGRAQHNHHQQSSPASSSQQQQQPSTITLLNVTVVIQFLELFRRWMWCFLRIEREWIEM